MEIFIKYYKSVCGGRGLLFINVWLSIYNERISKFYHNSAEESKIILVIILLFLISYMFDG